MQPQKELQEKDFINESYSKNPFPFWLWLVICSAIVILFMGGGSWFNNKMSAEYASSPFLQVTNRDMSIFLWQFPEHMRVNAPRKTGYLPGFDYENHVGIAPGQADEWVAAPPELLFLYHTWKRLVSTEFSPRPIPLDEFKEFLNQAEEWKPSNWPKAPQSYRELIAELDKSGTPENLAARLPQQIKQAFQGWKNYSKEGDKINEAHPTFGQMQNFLKSYPHYARNYWRNIVQLNKPDYLLSNFKEQFDPHAFVPDNQISPFLKVAFFNALQSSKQAAQ